MPRSQLAKSTTRWPAEWERHAATLIAWPVRETSWPGIFDRIPKAFEMLVEAASKYEPVVLVIPPGEAGEHPRKRYGHSESVRLLEVTTDDSWIRDFGPITVWSEGRRRMIDFRFNAWGQKYPPWSNDDMASSRIARELAIPVDRLPWTVEGGALETNGVGLAVTTASCLLDRRRNRNMTRERMEAILQTWLGLSHIVWIDIQQGLAGDDTAGHIDQLARFVNSSTMVVAQCTDRSNPNHEPLERLRTELAQKLDRIDQAFDVIPLPIPKCVTLDGEQLPASYCNFSFVNGAVLVPEFGDAADEFAFKLLDELLPGHRIEPVPCRDLVWGLGAVHCLTQSIPAAPEKTEEADRQVTGSNTFPVG